MTSSSTCNRCGAPLSADARFCMSCGADVTGAPDDRTARMRSAEPTVATKAGDQALREAVRQATAGDYEILAELGRGGMATVYLAHDIALERKVAIKVMSPALLMLGEGMIERFKREAKTSAGLSHPNIIPIYAVRETADLLYFVMKFVPGRTLDSIIRELGPLPIRMVQTILSQVGAALGHAHRSGVIHRDIKPGNIMIDDGGWVVVTDFGIAKVAESHALTMTGATVGTPTYMSPEQCAAKDITGASDQYSLGVVAYEMLTGKVPFSADSIMAIMYAHFNEPPGPIQVRRPDCPPTIASVVMRMLEKDPSKRFPSVEEAVRGIGSLSLEHDDPIRTQMIGLARSSAQRRLMQEFMTPTSPVPPSRAGETASQAPGAVATLALVPAATAVRAGHAIQLALDARDGGGQPVQGRRVLWETSDPAVATVTPAGLVTGHKSGVATITARIGIRTAQAAVKVQRAGSRSRALVWGGSLAGVAAAAAAVVWLGPWSLGTASEPEAGPVGTMDTGIGQALAGDVATAASEAAQDTAPAVVQPPESPPQTRPRQPPATRPRTDPRPSAAAAARADSLVEIGRRNQRGAVDARNQAVLAGAAADELREGDSMLAAGQSLLADGRVVEAVQQFIRATELFDEAARQARQRAEAAVDSPARRAEPEPSPPAPAPDPEADRQAVEQVLQAYAQALESLNVAEVRRAYPGMTAQQERDFRTSFALMRSLDVRLQVASVDIRGDRAQAQVNMTWSVRSTSGDETQSPSSFTAVLERVPNGWRLVQTQ